MTDEDLEDERSYSAIPAKEAALRREWEHAERGVDTAHGAYLLREWEAKRDIRKVAYFQERMRTIRKWNEEQSAFSAVREATEQTTRDPSETLVSAAAASEHQDGLEQLARQNEQKGHTAPSQEMADVSPMRRKEAEQIVAGYEALGQAGAQAKAAYGLFSQEWQDATQARWKARPAWWLARERLAELHREDRVSLPAEGAVPHPFTGAEQSALVPPRREAAAPPFDRAAHKARVLRQSATVAANPTRARWPAG